MYVCDLICLELYLLTTFYILNIYSILKQKKTRET